MTLNDSQPNSLECDLRAFLGKHRVTENEYGRRAKKEANLLDKVQSESWNDTEDLVGQLIRTDVDLQYSDSGH